MTSDTSAPANEPVRPSSVYGDSRFAIWISVYLLGAALLASGATRGWPWPIQFSLLYAAIAGLFLGGLRAKDFVQRGEA